ncbi:MAG: hypothetical protein AB8C84_03270 [Oligoflexales bacterium]
MQFVFSALLWLVSVSSHGMGWEQLHGKMLSDIRDARYQVVIETPEFYDVDLAVALALADFRGCEVQVLVKKALSPTMRSVWPFVVSHQKSIQYTQVVIDGRRTYAFQGSLLKLARVDIELKRLGDQQSAKFEHSSSGASRTYQYDKHKSTGQRGRKTNRLPSMTIIQKAKSEERP